MGEREHREKRLTPEQRWQTFVEASRKNTTGAVCATETVATAGAGLCVGIVVGASWVGGDIGDAIHRDTVGGATKLLEKEPDWVFWAAFLIPVGLVFGATRELVSLRGETGNDAIVVLVASLTAGFLVAGVVGIRWALRDRRNEKRRSEASRPAYVSIGGAVGIALFVFSDLLPSTVKIGFMSGFAGVLTAALIATAISARRAMSHEE